LPAFLYAFAQTKVLSATAGILNSLTPVFTLIVGVIIFNSKMRGRQVAGTALGFIGASMLFINGFTMTSLNRYTLLIVIATISYAISVSLVQHKLSDLKPLVIGACSFLVIGVFSVVYLIFDPIPNISMAATSIGYVAILSLSSTFIATIIFYRLVQLSDALFASSVSYIVPVVALMWGLLDGEVLGLRHVLALTLVMSGVFLIRQKQT
jgi:drug/metabolite transporter (DMT)-like permease